MVENKSDSLDDLSSPSEQKQSTGLKDKDPAFFFQEGTKLLISALQEPLASFTRASDLAPERKDVIITKEFVEQIINLSQIICLVEEGNRAFTAGDFTLVSKKVAKIDDLSTKITVLPLESLVEDLSEEVLTKTKLFVRQGEDYLQNYQLTKGKEQVEKALLLVPNYSPALELQKEIQQRFHETNQLDQVFSEISQRIIEAEHLLEEGNYLQAETILLNVSRDLAERIKPIMNDDFYQAEAYKSFRKRLVKKYKSILKEITSLATIFLSTGKDYLAKLEFEEAVKYFQSASRIAPQQEEANVLLKETNQKIKNLQKVREVLEELQPNIEVELERIVDLSQLSAPVVEELIQIILKKAPSFGEYSRKRHRFVLADGTAQAIDQLFQEFEATEETGKGKLEHFLKNFDHYLQERGGLADCLSSVDKSTFYFVNLLADSPFEVRRQIFPDIRFEEVLNDVAKKFNVSNFQLVSLQGNKVSVEDYALLCPSFKDRYPSPLFLVPRQFVSQFLDYLLKLSR